MKRTSDELLTFIFDSISKIASLHHHDKLLPELAKMGRDIVFAERCSIWVWDRVSKKIWTKIAHGIQSIEMEENLGIIGYAIKENKTLIINDVQSHKHFNKTIDKKTGYLTKTMMVIPMVNQKDEVVGAIQVINKKNDELFTKTDLKYLQLASTYAAESISTILLMEEIDNTQKELIYILGMTGENRSKETGSHVKRVAEYSWLLAKLYGLSEKDCNILREVSPLHDIGKIAIPDSILNKPGKLLENEMNIMREHSELGYDILKHSNLTLLKAAAIVAHEHHEKYNGRGYPRELKGEEIHIYGRITALADVFDALGSSRVYKDAWDDEKIFSFIERERGVHFDPCLANLFLDNRQQFLEIRDRFNDE